MGEGGEGGGDNRGIRCEVNFSISMGTHYKYLILNNNLLYLKGWRDVRHANTSATAITLQPRPRFKTRP